MKWYASVGIGILSAGLAAATSPNGLLELMIRSVVYTLAAFAVYLHLLEEIRR